MNQNDTDFIADAVVKRLLEDSALLRDPDRLMTTKEVAQLCQVNRKEILRLIECGLPHYRVGKGFRFKRADVVEFLDGMRTVLNWKGTKKI